MSQRTYLLLSVAAISFIYAFVVSAATQAYFRFEESFGFALAVLLAGVIIATVVGLISGAAKQGAFKPGFYWAFVAATPLGAFALHLQYLKY